MNDALLLFILVGGIILVLLLLLKDKGTGRLRVGNAELLIDFENNRKWTHGRPPPRPGQLQPPPADFYLSVKGTDWRYPLRQEAVYIGRAEGSQIKLLDRSADTRQAVVYLEGNRYKINNLSRRTPTRVNGRTITTQFLGDGNTIQMGRTRLIFRRRRS